MTFTVKTNQSHTTMIIKLSFLLVLTRVSSHTDIFYQFYKKKSLYNKTLFINNLPCRKNFYLSTQNCRKLPSFLLCLDPLFPPPLPNISFFFFNKTPKIKLVIFEKKILYPCDSLYYSNVKKNVKIFPAIY